MKPRKIDVTKAYMIKLQTNPLQQQKITARLCKKPEEFYLKDFLYE
jgi:hypothetical protein